LRRGLGRSTVTGVSPVKEIILIVQRELRRNFRSAKGIALGVVTLLGGSVVALIYAKLSEIKLHRMGNPSPDEMQILRQKAIEEGTGDIDLAKSLSQAPELLLALLFITVWLTPLLVSLMGFDAVAPDLQHRTVRYWTLRSRRWTYLVAKCLGLFLTVSAVTLLMDIIIWIVCIARGEASFASTLGWGVKSWAISLPISLAWCSLATLISSFFRTPIVAMLVTFVVFFFIWVSYWAGVIAPFEPITYIYPNKYSDMLIHPHTHKVGIGLLACLGMAALYLGAGSYIFQKKDV